MQGQPRREEMCANASGALEQEERREGERDRLRDAAGFLLWIMQHRVTERREAVKQNHGCALVFFMHSFARDVTSGTAEGI